MAVEFANETTKRACALYSDWPENILIVPELNGRHEHTDVETLAADIAKNGQLVPVICRKNDQGLPVLVAGHRRYRAICLLNERNPEQPMRVKFEYAAVTEVEAFSMAIRENRNRKDVSPIDDCANIITLRKRFQFTDEDIATIYFPEAKTDEEKAEALRYVKQRASLVELAPEAADAVREGRVKLTAAVGLAKLTKDQQREKVSRPGRVKVSDVAKKSKAKPQPAEAPAPIETAPAPAPTPQPANGKGNGKHAPKTQAALCPEVMAVLIELVSDVALSDLNDDKVKRVLVDKELLLKLASFIVTTEADVNAANGVDVKF
jgi:ParB-like chromosome segregation protein Spo0J